MEGAASSLEVLKRELRALGDLNIGKYGASGNVSKQKIRIEVASRDHGQEQTAGWEELGRRRVADGHQRYLHS